MNTHDQNSKTPTNSELASEAKITTDKDRQVELAKHPSSVVQWHLAQNENLSIEAINELGGLMAVDKLRKTTREAVENIKED